MNLNTQNIEVVPTPFTPPIKYISGFKYSVMVFDGHPIVYNSLELDASYNPILPDGYTTDSNQTIRDPNGEHIVLVHDYNTQFI